MTTKWFSSIDWFLTIPALILIFFSLLILFSVNTGYFLNQLVFSIICIVVFLFFSQIDLVNIKNFAKPLYIFSLIALTIVLLIGLQTRGAVRWIDVLGFRLQFSELLKPVLIFCFAAFLSNNNHPSWKTLLSSIIFWAPVIFLIYKQPDLGNALIYLFVFLMTMFAFGFPLLWFALGAGSLVFLIPFSLRFLHAYQKQRLLTFFHLSNDPLGSSYNAIQAVIAVGSGMLMGKGVGLGTQSMLKFLPERHTDFFFATLSEELGFVGALVIIVIFGVLLCRIFIIFTDTKAIIEKTYAMGAFFLLLIQFFINAGMNIGLLPIVGVTLPFLSYGGSSLLSNAILLGLLSSISRNNQRKHSLVIT